MLPVVCEDRGFGRRLLIVLDFLNFAIKQEFFADELRGGFAQ